MAFYIILTSFLLVVTLLAHDICTGLSFWYLLPANVSFKLFDKYEMNAEKLSDTIYVLVGSSCIVSTVLIAYITILTR